MRKKIVAGNWKMNTTPAEGEHLVSQIIKLKNASQFEAKLIVAPPFTHLSAIAKLVNGTEVGLSAQNCADQLSGAYTGEDNGRRGNNESWVLVVVGGGGGWGWGKA